MKAVVCQTTSCRFVDGQSRKKNKLYKNTFQNKAVIIHEIKVKFLIKNFNK